MSAVRRRRPIPSAEYFYGGFTTAYLFTVHLFAKEGRGKRKGRKSPSRSCFRAAYVGRVMR